MSVRNIIQAMAPIVAIADVPIREALSASVGGGVNGGATVSAETHIYILRLSICLFLTPRCDQYNYMYNVYT